MELKFLICSVLVTVTQSSVASGSPNPCELSIGEIKDDLETIEFAKESADLGLERVNDNFYTQMRKIVKLHITGNKTEEYPCYPEDEEMQEQAYHALMLGITPVLDVLRIVHPNFNITAGYNRSSAIITQIIKNFYFAMRCSCNTKDYINSKAQIDDYGRDAKRGARALIGNMINGIRGTNFPPEIEPLIACAQESITSKILGAFDDIINGCNFVLVQLSRGFPDGIEYCFTTLEVIRKKSSAKLHAEVKQKYEVISNLRKGMFLKENGIIPGLFALQSI